MRAPSPEQARRRGAPGPWFLSAALALLVVAAAFAYFRRGRGAPYAPPIAGDPEQAVRGWRGELEFAGGRLSVEVAPLHADAARQHFETENLRRKLARPDGEPWRVRLLRGALAEGGTGGDSAGRAVESVDVHGLTLHDEGGLAAAQVRLPAVDSSLQDPVWTLFRAPEGGLGPAQAVDLVLWGRALEERPELRAGMDAAAARLVIALEPTEFPRSQLERPFTHRTRGAEVAQDGKTRASGTSERRPRSRNSSDG